MKAYVVLTTARQMEGEFVFVKPEKGFLTKEKADSYASGLARKYTENIETDFGPINCVCERGILEIEIEE